MSYKMQQMDDLEKILVTEEQIKQRVATLGREITQTYAEVDELTIITIVNGSIMFTADLLRQIDLPLRLDSMRVSSYRDDTRPRSAPEVIDNLRIKIRGQHVLVIDDILDTGRTFVHVRSLLNAAQPASLRIAVLLDKPLRREVNAKPDFVGFVIPDEFVVGYGLDFAEHYRNLPCIGTLRPELQNPPVWQ